MRRAVRVAPHSGPREGDLHSEGGPEPLDRTASSLLREADENSTLVIGVRQPLYKAILHQAVDTHANRPTCQSAVHPSGHAEKAGKAHPRDATS